MNIKRLSEIEAKPIERNMTFFPDLDILYGVNELEKNNLGMPVGKISLWAGQSGVGKSRLCIEVAKKFSTNYIGGVVLYFQTESPLSDFASWAKDTKQYDDIYCSGENKIDEMIKIIYHVKPKLIFIDSVNMIEEFETGNKKEARRLIQGIDGKIGLKQVTHEMGAHTILLGQLNQDGKTIKGGTSLPHLVDIALNVVKTDTSGVFMVEVGSKHRYGSTENTALFRHTDDGVEAYTDEPESECDRLRREHNISQDDVDKFLKGCAEIEAQNAVEAQNVVHPQYRRVKAMTRSGTCRVGANGFSLPGDPEWQEHLNNYKNSPEGRAIVNKYKKTGGNGLYGSIGNFLGNIFGQ